jgi:hypothetical protein
MVSSRTFEDVKKAIQAGAVHVSVHARDEAVADDLRLPDIEAATLGADCIEDYPDDPRGPSCLLLCAIGERPIHTLWGFDEHHLRAILITVYRPDSNRWSNDLRTRRRNAGEPE